MMPEETEFICIIPGVGRPLLLRNLPSGALTVPGAAEGALLNVSTSHPAPSNPFAFIEWPIFLAAFTLAILEMTNK